MLNMADVNEFEASTPIQNEDSKKRERELSTNSINTSVSNPEKKTRPDFTSEDNISAIVNPPPVHLAESDFQRMSNILKGALKSDIETLVQSVVTEVSKSFATRIETLEKENKSLRSEVKLLTGRISTLETASETAEQYSRRNCLRVVGVTESPYEVTDDIVMDIASETGANISPADIDRSHRLKQPSHWTTPKSMIIKFATYRARNAFYRARSELKGNARYGKVFINEDLTSFRSKLFKSARKLYKDKLIQNCWTFDGRVFIKDLNDKQHLITKPSELEEFSK